MSGRGKKRAFDFSAVEHVGNDADIGGFLGNTEAEEERTTERLPVPSPASERVLTAEQPAAEEPAAEQPAAEEPAAEEPAAEQPAAEEPAAEEPAAEQPAAEQPAAEQPAAEQPAAEEPAAEQPAAEQPAAEQPAAEEPAAEEPAAEQPAAEEPAAEEPAAEQPAAEEPAAEEPAAEQPAAEEPAAEEPAAEQPAAEEPVRRRRPQARDQGVRFTSITSDPPILRTKAKKTKLKPGQAAVVNSFLDQRTRRNWVSWSGRLVPDTENALKDRAYEDAEASGRRLLSASHYFDAAIKSLPEDSDEVERLATDWLIDRWDGEHPKGENAQFTISPEAQQRLTELKKSLRGTRHGIWIDVLSAAGDCLLDLLQDEGPMPSP
ncbi:hypothetical protein OG749_46180 (plasmid) [Streptomyces nojiriensis]|uniref:hypothetical protein n=1 Tax=Streptomyces nojiriensis TaxID=66374 RepID=UPI002E175C58